MTLGRAQHQDGATLPEVIERIDIANAMRMLVDHIFDTCGASARQDLMSVRIVRRGAGADEVHPEARRDGRRPLAQRAQAGEEGLEHDDAGGQQRARIDHVEPAVVGIEQERRAMHGADQIVVLRRAAHRHGGDDGTLGHIGIALEHAGEIARRHAGDQRGIVDRPRLEPGRELVGPPGARIFAIDTRPPRHPRVLVVDAERHAETAMYQPTERCEEIRRNGHQHEIRAPLAHEVGNRPVAPPEGPYADVADQPDRPRRQGCGLHDLEARRDQPLEIGIESLLVAP